jgi:hypothetical protein
MVTIVTTLTSTLLVLGNLNVVIALELKGFVLNKFCTSIFMGHFPNLCFALEQIIQR